MGIGICPSRGEIALLSQNCEIRLAACEIGFACEKFSYEKNGLSHFCESPFLFFHPEGIPQHAEGIFHISKGNISLSPWENFTGPCDYP